MYKYIVPPSSPGAAKVTCGSKNMNKTDDLIRYEKCRDFIQAIQIIQDQLESPKNIKSTVSIIIYPCVCINICINMI